MKIQHLLILAFSYLPMNLAQADSAAVTQLLNEYKLQGAGSPEAEEGRLLWVKTFKGDNRFPERSCTSCHTAILKKAGKHVKTRKSIEPMSPSVNPERLKSVREINKWFKRNCKWTMGRECTATEKANLLVYLKQQ